MLRPAPLAGDHFAQVPQLLLAQIQHAIRHAIVVLEAAAHRGPEIAHVPAE